MLVDAVGYETRVGETRMHTRFGQYDTRARLFSIFPGGIVGNLPTGKLPPENCHLESCPRKTAI